MSNWITLPEHIARTHSDGPPSGLTPVRLVPVEVFGVDECDNCGARQAYGLMDAVSAWSDCNRAEGRIYRRDEDESLRDPGQVVVIWVEPSEVAKFAQLLGNVTGHVVEPQPERDEDGEPATLKAAARDELVNLWTDLETARREAIGGGWSIRCAALVDRMETLTRFVGATRWQDVPVTLLENGDYQGIHDEWGVPYPAIDIDRVAEVRAVINGRRR